MSQYGKDKLTKLMDENMERAVVDNPTEDGQEELRQEYFEELESQDGLESVVNAFRRVRIKGREFKLERRNPYGLWNVVPKKGMCPEALSGKYTSAAEAIKAVEIYVNSQ